MGGLPVLRKIHLVYGLLQYLGSEVQTKIIRYSGQVQNLERLLIGGEMVNVQTSSGEFKHFSVICQCHIIECNFKLLQRSN